MGAPLHRAVHAVQDGGDQVVGAVGTGHAVVEQRGVFTIGGAAGIGLVAVGAAAAEHLPAGIGAVDQTALRVFRLQAGLAIAVAWLGLAACHRLGLLEVGRHGLDIAVGQVLQAVLDGFGHRASGLGLAGHAAGLQVLHQLGLGPAADAVDGIRGDVGRIPGAQRAATQVAAAVFGHQRIARGVAGAAVGQRIDQVGAMVPLRRLAGIGFEALVLQVERIPHGHRQADVEGERQGRLRRGLVHRLDAMHEVGVERLGVFIGDLGIGRVGHGRVEVGPVLAYALAQRTAEIFQAVAANADRLGRGDIGGIDGAQRGAQWVATGKAGASLGCRVAGGAVRGYGQLAAFFHQQRIGRGRGRCRRRSGCWLRGRCRLGLNGVHARPHRKHQAEGTPGQGDARL